MTNGFFSVPKVTCEKVKSYSPGSKERKEAQKEYEKMISKVVQLPMVINGKKIINDKNI